MSGTFTRRRRRRWWVAALLPVLLLRALIPAGFMPAVGADSLAFVFCEPGVLAAAGPAAHHDRGHDGAGHAGHSMSRECPFAQSAAPALPTLAVLAPAQPRVAHVAACGDRDVGVPSIPLRHTAARGPPALS